MRFFTSACKVIALCVPFGLVGYGTAQYDIRIAFIALGAMLWVDMMFYKE